MPSAASDPSWQILITTIPHRHQALCRLLESLDAQLRDRPGVRVLIYRDNLEARYGAKCDALVRASSADYICFVDDDDEISPHYVSKITEAMTSRPDYVGFTVTYMVSGVERQQIEHSLRHRAWISSESWSVRDFCHKNPIRRDLALMGTWGDHIIADMEWATSLRTALAVAGMRDSLREEWIPEPLYVYRVDPADSMELPREPLAGPFEPVPAYPWLDLMEASTR